MHFCSAYDTIFKKKNVCVWGHYPTPGRNRLLTAVLLHGSGPQDSAEPNAFSGGFRKQLFKHYNEAKLFERF